MWSCVLQLRHTGLAAAAVPGLKARWSSPGYLSSSTLHTFEAPDWARYCQPFFGANRPPKARSTTSWSSSAKECERGRLCSRVKPCGIISLSHAGFGEGPVSCDFSERAGRFQFVVANDSYCSLWQPPQLAGSMRVTGRCAL